MENKDDKRKLYDVLANDYAIGTFDEFSENIQDESKRRQLYDATIGRYELGNYEEFSSRLGFGSSKKSASDDSHVFTDKQLGIQEEETQKSASVEMPSLIDNVEEARKKQWQPAPMFDTEVSLDEEGNKQTKAITVPSYDEQGRMRRVYRDRLTGKEYDPQDSSEEVQQAIGRGREFVDEVTAYDNVPNLKEENRAQVSALGDEIAVQLNKAYEVAREKNKAARPSGWQSVLQDMADASHGTPFATSNAYETMVEFDDDVLALNAARRSVSDAKTIIAEADKSVKEGNFDGFFKGAGRGFGQKLFDARTWDMGLTDIKDMGTLNKALDAFDNGEKLTNAQQMLLDAKAVELATNAYFGSYIGRGYKAGGVTAESIPFMIEMCINPASAAGKTAQSALTRYALKRFGKETVKRNAKKYLLTKVGTRVLGDAAGAAAMAATSGSTRVLADAERRMAGDVQFDVSDEGRSVFAGRENNEKDLGVALAKGFGSTAIENHSEMLGNYFAPLGKAARARLDKVGLGKVNQFIDDVASSDIGRLVTDFEKHANYNGVIGEYVEEVAGGVENALLVGDQTLDTTEGTGVFNLDQNIDTFLGVSLMGGFFSVAKTAGYRSPKYRARKDMERTSAIGRSLFDPTEWGAIQGTFASGTDEEIHNLASDILTDEAYTPEQRQAAIHFAGAAQKYKGALKGEQKKRHGDAQDVLQNDLETSYDNGYTLATPQEMHDAKNMMEYRRGVAVKTLGEDVVASLDANPIGELASMGLTGGYDEQAMKVATAYANSKVAFDGMIQRVRDDIDGKIDQSNAMVDSHTSKTDGMVHPATMKVDERAVYIVGGNVVMYEDGSASDNAASDESVIIRDAKTGKIEMVSPDAIMRVDAAIDPMQEKQTASEAIRNAIATEAADMVDGILSFTPGDTYTILGEDGSAHEVTIVGDAVDDKGVPMPDAVVATVDGVETTLPKDEVSARVESLNQQRVVQFVEEQEAGEEALADESPAIREYRQDDYIALRDDEGNMVRGTIVTGENADGLYELQTEVPFHGKRVQLISREELDARLMEQNGEEVVRQSVPKAAENAEKTGKSVPKSTNDFAEALSGVEAERTLETLLSKETDEVLPDAISSIAEFEQEFSSPVRTILGEVVRIGRNIYNKLIRSSRENISGALRPTLESADFVINDVDGSHLYVKMYKKQDGTKTYNVTVVNKHGEVEDYISSAHIKSDNNLLNKIRNGAELSLPSKRTFYEGSPSNNSTPISDSKDISTTPISQESASVSSLPSVPQDEQGNKLYTQAPVEATLWDIAQEGLEAEEVDAFVAANRTDAAKVLKKLEGKAPKMGTNIQKYKQEKAAWQAQVADAQAKVDYWGQVETALQASRVQPGDAVAEEIRAMGEPMNGYELAAQMLADGALPLLRESYLQETGMSDKDVAGMFGLLRTKENGGMTVEQAGEQLMLADRENGTNFFDQNDPNAGRDALIDVLSSVRSRGELGKYIQNNRERMAERERAAEAEAKETWTQEVFHLSADEYDAYMDFLERENPFEGVDLQEIDAIFAEAAYAYEQYLNNTSYEQGRTNEVVEGSDGVLPSAQVGDSAGVGAVEGGRDASENGGEVARDDAASYAEKLADYKRRTEAAIAYVGQYIRLCETHAITSEEEIRAFAEHGVGREFIEDLIEEFNNPESSGYYLEEMDAAFIWVNSLAEKGESDLYIQGCVLHEQVHSLVNGSLYTEEEFANYAGMIREAYPDIATIVDSYYGKQSEKIQNEEVVSIYFDEIVRAGLYEDVLINDKFDMEGETPAMVEERLYVSNLLKNRRNGKQSGRAGSDRNTLQVGNRPEDGENISVGREEIRTESENQEPVQPVQGQRELGAGEASGLPRVGLDGSTRQDNRGREEGQGGVGEKVGLVQKPLLDEPVDVRTWMAAHPGETPTSSDLFPSGQVRLQLGKEISSETVTTDLGVNLTRKEYEGGYLLRVDHGSNYIEQAYYPDGQLMALPRFDMDVTSESMSQYIRTDRHGFLSIDNESLIGAFVMAIARRRHEVSERIAAAEAEVDVNPTDAQKEAGNYKKGHVQVGTFNITIEQPRGSIRSGVDANGEKWETEMQNTYGYIRGTEGVDGDHIDVFLSNDIDYWNGTRVFIIDQYNPDGTFDEHKVMLGFNEQEEAEAAFLSNYDEEWAAGRRLDGSSVLIEDFEKWIASSHRKTKPFAEYKSVKNVETSTVAPGKNEGQFGLVSDARMEELKVRLRKKLGGQLNVGIDPEILSIGMELAAGHIDRGVKSFGDFTKRMIEDLGDVIRPYLKAFYNGARDLPEIVENGLSAEMTPYDDVIRFDVANFGKSTIDAIATTEMVVSEQEKMQQAEVSKGEIVKKRNEERKKSKKKSVTSQADLFGSLFEDETLNDSENGLQGNDAVRAESLSADSDRHEQRLSRGSEKGSESESEAGSGLDAGGKGTGVEVDRTVRPRLSDAVEADIAPSERKNTHNNHSERGANHAPTSVDARIEANIKAIELAQQLIDGGEQATEQQMKALRKFSGWGGLGKAFSDSTYSARIQELLGAEAYQEAVMSANSTYYTPAYVVDTLWDIATQMGFKGGNILEGSAGIGNILGQMPTSISERSDIHAIEIDRTSGGILSLLYPDAKVEIQGFEDTRIPNGSVDLAITNVPFVTGLRVNDTTGDKDLSKKFHNIHDFCIAKNVRKLREGGIGLFITSNGTLDNSKKLRDWIVNEGGADFIGAFRMHNKTFGGTGVTSDIIVIRKRVNGIKSANAIDVSTITGERSAEFDTGEKRKVKGEEVAVIKHLAMDYNRYFIEHPENMAGVMLFAFEQGETFRPTSKGLYPVKGKNQEQMLAEFVGSFKEETDDAVTLEESSKTGREYVMDASADGKKLGELYVKDGKLVIAGAGGYYPLSVNANKVKGHTKVECFNAYAAIKEALAEVLAYQTENESDEGLKPLLAKLNKAYDSFVTTYGHFNKNTAISFLRNDVDYPNVFSLERYEETGDKSGNRVQKFGKADVFSQRVVEKEKEPTPTNVKDGIIASVFKFGRIDVSYIAEQLDKSVDEVKSEIIESGYGFEDPATRQMELSYQYLSGNVREKLRQAQENNEGGAYDRNIKALQEVVPMDIPAHLIDFTLGSSWIAPKLYEDYVLERTDIEVKFTAAGGTWYMDAPYYVNKEKNRSMGVYSEMFKTNIFGHTLIEAAISNKTVTVSRINKKWDGSTETITDREATQACSAKIDEIRQDFKDWARQKMQSDAEMSADMERLYNDTFNNYVPMSIPDDFVPEYFGGASHKFKMRPHQGRAIVRGTMQPLLLAHEVGTGKTFTLISTAMEMRRLGTARKPMIVVQNATVGQFVASAKELYPNAKILTLEEADRTAEGRKNFYAKIRHNDWDMIVVPQSTFEFIPDSEERQMQFVQDKIEEKMAVLEKMQEADPRGESMITRQAKKEIADLEAQLADLSEQASSKRSAAAQKKREVTLQNAEVQALEMLDRRTDDVENFDDMGIDALLVDEAHEYKHLGFATAMQRGVKGVDASYSKKSQGVYLKTQAVLEKNNGRNVIFATGTPISNTAAEIWTFMRYLMTADTMKEYGIYYFDDFVRNFGNIQQMLEFTTSGKFKENNRFAGYVNLPELVRIWSGVSDTVLTKEAGGVSDKIPEMEGGKAQDLYLPQTRALRSIMKFVKAELMRFEEMSGKEKKENSHIPLTMYGIAKSAAVDARLVDSGAEDDPNSKTNEAVRQTLRSLKETAKYKGTVAIFSDNYQNKASGFNLYDDIRNKLIAEGIPADEIVVIRSGMTVKKKLDIFEKVNRGEIRVVLGSTFTLGTGVNIHERLHTVIHLDAPNRPMDYTQRNGRILRQGNLHKAMDKPVRILRFGVEDSLDVTAYQRLKTKGAIADSIMNGKQMMANSMTNRVLEEEEDVFGDTVAQLSGSEYAMLKNNAEKNVRKYESRKKGWEADQTYIHNAKPRYRGQIAEAEQRAETNRKFLQAVQEAFPGGKFTEITAGKQTFAAVEDMADFFKEHNKKILEKMKQMKEGGEDTHTRELTVTLGGYTFKMRTELSKESSRSGGQLFAEVHRKMTYSCPELGLEDVPVHQNLLRNAIEDIVTNVITGKDYAERAEAAERKAKHLQSELEQILSREGVPFEFEEELAQARAQYAEYSELMKKEMEEKEAKYAEMDKTVEAASDIATVEDEDDLMREGEGGYTDEEVSIENDPMSKLAGESIRTKRQQKEYARKVRERMRLRIKTLGELLHVDIDVLEEGTGNDERMRRAKGYFNPKTGKVTVVIGNHASLYDLEKTVLHEAVAHYGLRKLFGKQFDQFLWNVFNNASPEVREKISALMAKHGWDYRVATEEYLASLAEDTNFNNTNSSWWNKIKSLFLDMLHSIGWDYKGPALTNNELRYILWRSYMELTEPGSRRSILGKAADIAKQYDLKVGNYETASSTSPLVAESKDEILRRDGDPEIHERTLARNQYEQRVKSGMYQSKEALQDSMLGLKEAMTAILGQGIRIEEVDGFENAYLGENRLSSVNKAEADAFAHLLFKPMLEEVAKLAHSAAEREELTDYMMAKHGLERNRIMAERDAQKDFAEHQKQHPKSTKTLQDFIDEYRQRDYAGLTALTGMEDVADAEAEAQAMVDEYENAHDTAELWSKVNAVSKAILSKSYECGMMSKETYDSVSDMYEFYIPLRGFDEKTSAEAYAYLTHKQSAFNAPIKKAQGRKSKADDPFANLQSMAESAIMQGNRNRLVKQKFLNFALNHPSDLVSVSDLWLQYNAVTDEWQPVFPDNIDINDSPEEVERKMQEFEDKMKQLAEATPDNYKRGKDAANIPYRVVESRDLRQHQVVVKRNGRDYVITINGNPRAAQALNGQTNPDNDISGAIGVVLRLGEQINRQLSAFYTTRNPDFIVSNFMRDMLYTNSMAWIKESPNYALRFHRNYVMANPVMMKRLLAKYRKGTLDMSKPIEAMFHQFMMNGGETGYANIRDIEQHKNGIRRELKRANGKLPVSRAWTLLGERFDEYNRAVENCARFAAFMTSREMGRTIDRAIYDAKEISVNFNKKGSGAKFLGATGQTKLGNSASFVSGLGRSGYVFWNAAIQGTTNFGRQMKRHPAKAFTGAASMFLLGALMAYLGYDDDEDDKNTYYNLPEYVRRSNILFSAGDHWISIPLPIEYRAFYGMGELMTSVLSDKEHMTGGEIANAIAGQISQIMPIDFMEGGGGMNAFVPSAVKPVIEAYVTQKSWTGMPLYKDTPYNENMPEWTKAYKSANKYIVNLAETLNEETGGDHYTKGTIDINPAKIENILNGYFGGVFGTIDKMVKSYETIAGDREYDPRSILLWNRIAKAGDERTEYRAVNNEYFRLEKEYKITKQRLKGYENDTRKGIFDYAEKIDFLYNSPAYQRYAIFEAYHPTIDAYYDVLKEPIDDADRKAIEAELNEIKKELISVMNQTRKR